jgi:hypothetical protein
VAGQSLIANPRRFKRTVFPCRSLDSVDHMAGDATSKLSLTAAKKNIPAAQSSSNGYCAIDVL